MKPDYSKIPEDTLADLRRYIEHGVPLGGCLEAIVSNNLYAAFSRADDAHIEAMFHIVAWLHNVAPSVSWGSPGVYSEWLSRFRGGPSAMRSC